MDEKKDLEIVSDDGSSLDISPVYDHLNVGKPKSAEEKPTNIVIPQAKKENDEEKDEDNEKDNENEDENKGENENEVDRNKNDEENNDNNQ